jgi:hypothetical protein
VADDGASLDAVVVAAAGTAVPDAADGGSTGELHGSGGHAVWTV